MNLATIKKSGHMKRLKVFLVKASFPVSAITVLCFFLLTACGFLLLPDQSATIVEYKETILRIENYNEPSD
jgi:hypothetical protein